MDLHQRWAGRLTCRRGADTHHVFETRGYQLGLDVSKKCHLNTGYVYKGHPLIVHEISF